MAYLRKVDHVPSTSRGNYTKKKIRRMKGNKQERDCFGRPVFDYQNCLVVLSKEDHQKQLERKERFFHLRARNYTRALHGWYNSTLRWSYMNKNGLQGEITDFRRSITEREETLKEWYRRYHIALLVERGKHEYKEFFSDPLCPMHTDLEEHRAMIRSISADLKMQKIILMHLEQGKTRI